MSQSKVEEVPDTDSDAEIKIIFDSDDSIMLHTQESDSDDMPTFTEDIPTFDLLSSEDKFREKYGKDVDDTMSFITAKDFMDNKDEWRLHYKQQLRCNETLSTVKMHAFNAEKSIRCNVATYYANKCKWLQYFAREINRGYYNGNLAFARCTYCAHVIDAFPCKEKRIYQMPKKECPFCDETWETFNNMDYNYFKRMKPKTYYIEYICK